PNRSIIVYIDGIENRRIPADGFNASAFSFRSFWGAADVTIDDLTVNDEASSLHPAVVQAVSVGDGKDVKLLAGQPLKLDLSIDPKGASAKSGLLKIELFDLQEKLVSKTEKKLDWNEFKGSKLSVELPAPPASKHYWVLASYRDEGAELDSSCTIEKIDVQFLSDPKVLGFRGRFGFQTPWDWIPADRKTMDSVPLKWDAPTKFSDFWFNGWDRRFKDVTAGWYRRKLEIPADWAGRRILLSIEQPSNVAKAFINGVTVGEVAWPGGELDITGKVKPGAKAELVILVDSEVPGEIGKAAEEALKKGAKLPDWYGKNSARGLGGGVELLSEPMGARIDSVMIAPRVPAMILNLDFQTLGLAKGSSYSVEGTVSKAGKILKTFKSENFKADADKRPVSVSIPWPDAEIWDIGKPNLYDLDARLVSGGKTVDAILPERFGFREVTFDGRLVKINGNPVNFVTPMPTETQGNFGFAKCLERCNLNYMSSGHHNFYHKEGENSITLAKDQFDVCDEAGFGSDLGVSDISLRKFLVNYNVANGGNFLEDKFYWPALEKVVRRAIKRYGNRPSIFFLLGGGNGGQLEMGNVLNPAKMDGIWLKS
ncbi:MAG: hypothetical protein WC637_19910, partial [Victivallales bacterium]